MDLLKKIWPTPFKIEKGNVTSLVIQLVIFLVICVVLGFLIGILALIPIIGLIFGLVGSLMGIYSLVGIILCLLVYFDKLN